MRLTKAFFLLAISFLILLSIIFTFISAKAQDLSQDSNCLDISIMRIRSLPELKYLQTLDGQQVPLDEIFATCLSNWPMCVLYEKFYYWQTEVREIISNTPRGEIQHKIRIYNNCLSTCYPKRCDPRKTHGDVAEFYDENGRFMGLAVYMGEGMYCSLPYDEYQE